MKKILLILISLFYVIIPVNAKEELIIDTLEITNGAITPKYDKYNNYYSVTISEDTKNLEFNYTFDNNKYDVKITNNENLVENKMVYVTIYNKESNEQNTYIFKVYIENTLSTIETKDIMSTLDIKTDDNTNYAPVIGTICFSLIIFIYYLIFLR